MSKAQIKTFWENRNFLTAVQEEVYNAIQQIQPCTIGQVAEQVPRKYSTVGGRVSELHGLGYIKIVDEKVSLYNGRKSSESVYMICTPEEVRERQIMLFNGLNNIIHEYKIALVILGNKTPYTSSLLSSEIDKHQSKLKKLRYKVEV